MPPDGVVVHARCTNQFQADYIAGEFAKADLPNMDAVDWLGEQPMVIRVRKTPTYWNVESWPRSMLAQTEGDVSFP